MYSWSRVLKSVLTQRSCSIKSCNHPFPFSFALPPETAWINGIVQSISVNTSSSHFPSKMYPTKRLASHLLKSVCSRCLWTLTVGCGANHPRSPSLSWVISLRGQFLLYKAWPPTSTSPAWTLLTTDSDKRDQGKITDSGPCLHLPIFVFVFLGWCFS